MLHHIGPLRVIFQYPPVFLKIHVYIYYLLNTSNAVFKDTPHIFVTAQRSAIQWARKQNNKVMECIFISFGITHVIWKHDRRCFSRVSETVDAIRVCLSIDLSFSRFKVDCILTNRTKHPVSQWRNNYFLQLEQSLKEKINLDSFPVKLKIKNTHFSLVCSADYLPGCLGCEWQSFGDICWWDYSHLSNLRGLNGTSTVVPKWRKKYLRNS